MKKTLSTYYSSIMLTAATYKGAFFRILHIIFTRDHQITGHFASEAPS